MKKSQFVTLFLILAIGFVARLYKIDNPIADWHSWRQADTASVTRFFVQDGIDLLRPRYHDISNIASGYDNPRGWRFVEFPLYNGLHAAAFKVYPVFSLEKWGRLVSVAASLVTTIFVFLLGGRFLGTAGGLLAAFFFAAAPFGVYFSRVVLPEPTAVLFATASLWFFVLWIDKGKLWQVVLSGMLFSLAILIKPFTVFFAAPMLYMGWAKYGLRGMANQVGLWIFLSLSLSPFFFWRGWMWSQDFLRGIPHWKWAFNGDEIRFKPSFWWWIFGERLGRLILGIWAAVPFVLGLVKPGRGKFPWFIHSFIGGQFLYSVVVATASVRHDYYQTLWLPAVSLVLAAGTLVLWNLAGSDRSLRRLAAVATVVAGLALSGYQIRGFYQINNPAIISAGTAADKLLPADALVIAPYSGDTAFLYQTKRSGWPYITLPLQEMIDDLGAQYYVSVNFDAQTKDIVNKYKVLEQTNDYVIVDLRQGK